MTQDQPTAGRFDGREHLLPVRVYYEDTDFTGLVYHANYVRYFERGRSDFLRAIGVGHADLLDEALNVALDLAAQLLLGHPQRRVAARVVDEDAAVEQLVQRREDRGRLPCVQVGAQRIDPVPDRIPILVACDQRQLAAALGAAPRGHGQRDPVRAAMVQEVAP